MAIDKLNLYYKEERKSPITELYNNLIHEFKDIPQLPDKIKDQYPHYQMLIDDSIGNLINIISGKVKDSQFVLSVKDVGDCYFSSINKTIHDCYQFQYRCKHPKQKGVFEYTFTFSHQSESIGNLTILDVIENTRQNYITLGIKKSCYELILFQDDVITNSNIVDVYLDCFKRLIRATNDYVE